MKDELLSINYERRKMNVNVCMNFEYRTRNDEFFEVFE